MKFNGNPIFKCQQVQCFVLSRGCCGSLSLSPSHRLRHLMVSEETQCPAMNTLRLAHNKFEFRGNMILVSCVTWDKSHAAAMHRIAVSLQGSSAATFCGSHILPGASHWDLPSFPICKIGVIIPSMPFLSKFWLRNLNCHNISLYLFST